MQVFTQLYPSSMNQTTPRVYTYRYIIITTTIIIINIIIGKTSISL